MDVVAPAAGRVDAVLAAACPSLSRARLQRLIAAGQVRVNGGAVRKSVRVEPGDLLSFEVPEFAHEAPAELPALHVLYEDAYLIAVAKPPALNVHGAPGETGPTVAAWFVARYPAPARAFEAERPGIVHRLDRDTTGVLLLAKTPAAQAALGQAFEERATEKTYLALCDGVPPHDRAVIEAGIARHPGDRTKMAIARHGRAARTGYTLLAQGHGRSLLEVHPESGRTHQVRVHLAAVGAPVTFDRVYGRGGEGRQLLHAWRIEVPHPAGGSLQVTAPLPADFVAAAQAAGFAEAAFPFAALAPPVRTEASA